MNIRIEREAEKHIKEKDKSTRERLKVAIMQLPNGDVKKLTGSIEYRLRVGNLRVLFRIEGNTIIVRDVLPRGESYKRLRRE